MIDITLGVIAQPANRKQVRPFERLVRAYSLGHVVLNLQVRGDFEDVLVQPELEKERSPLMSVFRPFGRGFSRHGGLSIR